MNAQDPWPPTSLDPLGIGGDFSWDWPEFWSEAGIPFLFATGRDALAAIADSLPTTRGEWLVPDYTCPVVAKTLLSRDKAVRPYPWRTPWAVDEKELKALLPIATAIVVPFYMGIEPSGEIWALLQNSDLCVVEDRCQCVGLPPPAQIMHGEYAIGSFRKWLPVTDGAYCLSRGGTPPQPRRVPNREMARIRLAAALVKHTRTSQLAGELDQRLEQIAIELFCLGEILADNETSGRRASTLTEVLLPKFDIASICESRVRNQTWLAARLADKKMVTILEPEAGSIEELTVPLLALPVLANGRDQVLRMLAEQKVYCPVHWRDGNWSGGSSRAAAWASSVLSLPVDQRYNPSDLQRIVEVLG